MRKIYSAGYFESTKDGSLLSAEEIIPLVRQLREVKTVVDVGCGLGAWLYVWHQAGADILGLDGSWVKPDKFNQNEICKKQSRSAVDLLVLVRRSNLAMGKEDLPMQEDLLVRASLPEKQDRRNRNDPDDQE